ncbi:MAG: CDP-diacylglycerol--glycerol-3-phosphate 3-phosphatidyltransferase [Tissierellales bacterium]|jgi:CDP-diacylglycerol---glycerol-3-phosphate 3-phosphatidyltransferase|nr:CDP-diacylglycerol--glycerol-3-phosphate 3-phosphatidyltransferase [Tissierellales bacterium]MBN2828313.1 CDP-diacylglycerol--glycerol-3-phosphate 3-phosphatidyltransferase [Tissierellales bacterium]
MNLPNQLTILRIMMIPLFMFFILNQSIGFSEEAALLVYVMASLTDTLDGYIARKYNLITDFGKFMDPLADKLLVISSLVCFVQLELLNSWVAMIIISRELIITGFRTLAASKGVTLSANIWGKLKTIFQMVTIIMILVVNTGIISEIDFFVSIMIWMTVLLTLLSGTIYLFQNKHVLK